MVLGLFVLMRHAVAGTHWRRKMKEIILSFYIMVGGGPLEEMHAVAPDMESCEAARLNLISILDQDEHEVSFWIDCMETQDV